MDSLTPRQLADRYVHRLAELNPIVNTGLGLFPHDDALPDFSPAGHHERTTLASETLAELDRMDSTGWDDLERRCATLLRERLGVIIESHDAGEHLREIRNIFGPPQAVRQVFSLMPTGTDEDWAVIARRMARVPRAYTSWQASLDEGRSRGLLAAPRQALALADLIDQWVQTGWFADFVSAGPEHLRADLDDAARAAGEAAAHLAQYLRTTYAPAAEGTPDAVGEERYRLNARRVMGADVDPAEAYAWGWAEYQQIDAQMRELAERILPGSTPVECMRHLDEHGTVIHGEDEVRRRLQQMMDEAITELDGRHFDIAEPIRRVEAMIAPAGSAAAPYYTRPSQDFARPGRTWLPTLGRESFPMYDLVSTWYHEGVPGHHLQLAQWAYMAPQLSTFQTSVGSSSGVTEGWALYSERLMDELGYLDDEARMGYLDGQMMRAIRVVIDLGMHLELTIPADSPIAPGQTWTPELAERFFAAHSGRSRDFISSEVVRYLGWPGQAISYKLGERAWLAGREAARAAHAERGEEFDLKSWHMKALSLGALGLDDLEAELARL
ncbi:DUF885 domain-containing protein [Pseudactinotalea sp. Z1739]|uniref:DUF885 domain-containing protein n=1 Tax=Pseudactinotalea sp. Z1739 TaxID=3413028 RepID=UPI003C7CD285